MPVLKYIDTFSVSKPKEKFYHGSFTAHDLIGQYFKDGLSTYDHRVFLNEKEITPSGQDAQKILKAEDALLVVREQKGFVGKIAGGIFANDVIKGAFKILDLLPNIPEVDTALKGSPNNSYSGQTNQIREGAAKPLVLGSPVIYPDLIGQPIEEYINNNKQITQLFNIGFGKFDMSTATVRAGKTPLARFFGSSQVIYEPDVSGVTTVPNYRIGVTVDEIDGQQLKGTNEGEESTRYSLQSLNGTYPNKVTAATLSGGVFTYYVLKDAESDALKSSFDASGPYDVNVYYNLYEGGNPVAASGTGAMASMVFQADNGAHTDQYKIVVNGFDGPTSTTGEYNGGIIDPFDTAPINPAILGPFSCPSECEKLLLNVAFRRGLKGSVDLRVIVYELDSQAGARTGVSETFNYTVTEDTLDSQYRTLQAAIANGLSWYEFTIQRTNDAKQKSDEPDIAYIERVTCIDEYGDLTLSNATILKTVIPANNQPTSGGVDNKINVIGAVKYVKTYNVSTGQITDVASRYFADALLYMYTEFYKRPATDLDLDSLYEIQNLLIAIDPKLAYFDYTFDDVKAGMNDRMDTILNVAQCFKWRDSKYRFGRDEQKPYINAVLTRADIVADRSYTMTYTPYISGKYDSVTVEYIDRSINKRAYVSRKLSGSSVVAGSGLNPLKVKIVGSQNVEQATLRANVEMKKLLLQNWTLTDTFGQAANNLSKGNIVLYEEVFETDYSNGGEILAINGLSATLSEEVKTVTGGSLYYTDEAGNVYGPYSYTKTGDYAITLTSGNFNDVYLADGISSQVGSRYYIFNTTTLGRSKYVVQDKEIVSDGVVQLTMTNYSDDFYS